MQLENSNPFGPVNPADIAEFEETNEITLPSDYKDFLLQHNGGRPLYSKVAGTDVEVKWLYSMIEEPAWASLFNALDVYEGRIPSWYMPIGTDSGGNLYIMSLYKKNKGVIAFWRHEEEAEENGSDYFENLTHIADSFTEFVHLLQPNES
ncbi:SMI1/KNR4 family protein [Hymenobacter weizhouensis]|uniref:SMI1/KNR4 family protein n=1 Tax=Hymenobacter sp. YIM 151500-1 TaxID=2987689 RepID=UPI00222613A1|nr:SMI1/KNR4 family protein [Hymenobacter sp. YIM 151500-1]UYZ63417.1 SMI1/KNR4 family protein [Hymenobacter sp. YIM 151500-1]